MKRSASQSPPLPIAIRNFGRFIQVDLPSNEVFKRLTTCYLKSVPLYETEVRQTSLRISLGAGLEPVAEHLLKEARYQVRTIPMFKASTLPSPHGNNSLLLDFIRQHVSGLLHIDPEKVDPAWVIALAARAWPKLKIAVVVSCIEDGSRVVKKLRKRRISASFLSSKSRLAEVERIVVTTTAYLAHPAKYKNPALGIFDHNWLDLVFVLDAVEALGRKNDWRISHLCRSRLFGFLDRTEDVSPFERDNLVRMFGLSELTLPSHERVERPVEVLQYRIHGGPPLNKYIDRLQLKRSGVWQHPLRNRKISQLAKLLHEKDITKLKRSFGQLAPALEKRSLDRIILLVENVEHATVLAKRLPEWVVVVQPTAYIEGLSHELRLYSVLSPPDPPHSIVTFAALESFSLKPDIILRADGGIGLPPLPDQILCQDHTEALRPILMIDFIDCHQPQLASRSHSRSSAYKARGWFAAGSDILKAKIARFLATRPEVSK